MEQFPNEEIAFEPLGRMWRIVLHPTPVEHRWVCPFYDSQTARCRIQHLKPLGCVFYPFYVMRYQGRLVIATSRICPASTALDTTALVAYLRVGPGPLMVREARKHPDIVIDHREGIRILLEVHGDDLLPYDESGERSSGCES